MAGHGDDDRDLPTLSGSLPSIMSVIISLFYTIVTPFIPLIQRILFALLSLGPIPQHIGLIMDGNRRYAKTFPQGPLPVSQGHLSGFNALRSVLEACLHLKGLNTITVYAFAIDNFARDESEVQYIMELAKRNLLQLASHGEVLARHSVRLRMIGRREFLPIDVRLAVEKAEEMTRNNKRATLNVCIPYASRDEIAFAVNRCVQDRVDSGRNSETGLISAGRNVHTFFNGSCDHDTDEISVEDIEAKMMLAHSPPLDILVRTSGVCRLSDFMLWQSTHSQLQFTKRYWPLFGLRELVPIILDFQRMKMRNYLEELAR